MERSRGLARSLGIARKGISAMVPGASTLPSRRSVNHHAHPSLVEAVTVSRFWRSVQVANKNECWTWRGDTHKGYGVFYYQGHMRPAHELALSFSTGEVRSKSLETCHSCDNPPCCNPAHLRFGTRQANVDEMVNRGRAARQGRLTDQQVEEMRIRRANGARQIDLAHHYGITNGQVSMIVRGLRWPDAPGPIDGKRAQYKKEA